jgi:hypothetical protein
MVGTNEPARSNRAGQDGHLFHLGDPFLRLGKNLEPEILKAAETLGFYDGRRGFFLRRPLRIGVSLRILREAGISAEDEAARRCRCRRSLAAFYPYWR